MIAAIYCRKSTDQSDVVDEQKSVVRQAENARAFAASKGWVVRDDLIFVDDGISGSETHRLRGRARMIAAASKKAFDVVIMQAQDRFSRRDGDEAFGELKQLAKHVDVWFYSDGQKFEAGTFATNTLGFLKAEFAAEYRRGTAAKTAETMIRKFKLGHVVGGKVYGYDNVKINGHTERRIHETQAAVVRQIFTLCADGTGYSGIVKILNATHTPAPRAASGWTPSSVWEVLHRSLYVGTEVWNRSKKRDQSGEQDQRPRPASDWLQRSVPDLRIVTDDLWNRAHDRLNGIRARLQQIAAQTGARQPRRRGNESPYLLSGFARCAVCGGGIGVISSSRKGRRALFYACTAHHKRGQNVCQNQLAMPVDTMDDAILKTLGGDVLRPAVIMAIVDGVIDAMNPTSTKMEIERLTIEQATIDREITRFTDAIAAGGDLPSIIAALKTRQAKREELEQMIAAKSAARLTLNRKQIEAEVDRHVRQWRRLLTTRVEDGRQLLREVLAGPLTFSPEGKAYRFDGEAGLGAVLAGLVSTPTVDSSPTGFEPVFWP